MHMRREVRRVYLSKTLTGAREATIGLRFSVVRNNDVNGRRVNEISILDKSSCRTSHLGLEPHSR